MTSREVELEELMHRALIDHPVDEALARVRSEGGADIIEAIKCTRAVLGIGLGEAKELVVASKVWAAEVTASLPLHETLERMG